MSATYAFENIGKGNETLAGGNVDMLNKTIATAIANGGIQTNHTYRIVVYKDGIKIQETTLS